MAVVGFEIGQQRGRYRLLSLLAALLPEPDSRPAGVEIAVAEVEGALAAGAGHEVEPDEQHVQARIVAGEPDGVDELDDLPVIEGPAPTA